MSSVAQQTRLILRNDLRLIWREFRGSRWKSLGSVGLIAGLLLVAHALAILGFLGVEGAPPLVLEAVAWWFFALLMLSASMNNAIGLLFERADFDLLLSSPVNPRAVLLARLFSMATSALLAVAIFLVPLLNGAAIGLGPRYLVGYFVWAMVAVLTASTGVWMALGLVRWIGVRKSRVVGQVVAAVFGASLYLLMQLPRMLPAHVRDDVAAFFQAVVTHPLFTAVARAARGEPLALGALTLLAGCAAALTTRQMARTFIAGTQEATVAITRKASGARRHRWTEGLARATFRKDLRLILRDPLLLAQVLPSAFYVIPALLGFGRMGGIGLLAPVVVVIAAQFSMLLTAVAASGEEGWDLIHMSPARAKPLRFAKMAAGMALPLALATLVCVVLAFAGRPWLALNAWTTGVVVAAGCAWLQVTDIRPTPRKDVMRRRSGRSFMRGLASTGLLIGGSVAMGLAANGLVWFSLIPGALTWLGVAGCFALVEVKEVNLEASETMVAPSR